MVEFAYRETPTTQAGVLCEVAAERARQASKWGPQDYPSLCQALLQRDGGCSPNRMAEEYEIPSESRAKFLCDTAFDRGEGTYAHVLVEEVSEAVCAMDDATIRGELVQVAAVAVAWVEAIDRRLAGSEGARETGRG